MKHPSYRRKDLFLVPGHQYEVTTFPHRGSFLELAHPPFYHYFEKGTIVICQEIHWGYGSRAGVLMGDFYDPITGIGQSLTVMDVKAIKEGPCL